MMTQILKYMMTHFHSYSRHFEIMHGKAKRKSRKKQEIVGILEKAKKNRVETKKEV